MLSTVTKLEDWHINLPLLTMPRHSFFGALLLVLLACGPARVIGADCLRPANLPPTEKGQPRNLAGLKSQLVYYQCSGAYERDFRRVIDKAISYVIQRATKGATKGEKLALVLDIDETSLSNWEEIKANDFGLIEHGTCKLGKPDPSGWSLPESPCAFDAWELLADAKPLDTLRLFKVAKVNNVAVFFITGRRDDNDHKLRDATVENLRKAGYSDWTDLMLEPADYESTVQKFKTEKRKGIAKSYTIIANVGDQYTDLNVKDAERVYKVPNPFYFVP